MSGGTDRGFLHRSDVLRSQRARQDVKVALIGQGPDELFGGYKRHLGVHYGEWWRGLPGGLRSMIGFAVNGLPRNEMLKRGVSFARVLKTG